MTIQQRRMVIAWLLLAALSVASIGAGHSFSAAIPRIVLAGCLLMLSFFKASLVLSYYLELHRAPRWNRALHLALAMLLLAIFALAGFR